MVLAECKGGEYALPAVHDTTKDSSVYFVFANASEAQDAYAYFLYHKQLVRPLEGGGAFIRRAPEPP